MTPRPQQSKLDGCGGRAGLRALAEGKEADGRWGGCQLWG